MKKKILFIVAFCFFVNALPLTNVKAHENQVLSQEIIEQINNELEVAIISGDGSGENPYIVDYKLAPVFEAYISKSEEVVKQTLSIKNTYISTYGIFDGVLVGTAHYNQTRGGYWKYTNTPPSATSNGNIWMKAVNYIPTSTTVIIANMLQEQVFQTIRNMANSLVNLPLDELKSKIDEKIQTELAGESFAKAIGKISNLYTSTQMINFMQTLFSTALYSEAKMYGYGIINAVYQTSYQGSWYSHQFEDTWTTANTAYEPASAYGNGNYYSYNTY